MGRHFNSKLDDDTWRVLFGRWHAGEPSEALVAEAGVSRDTWRIHAKRLGMRIGDLPADHPRRRAPAFGERPADYRHRNSLLTEGQWAALFLKRAQGVPDAVLVAEYGVQAATIGTQAKKRELRRADLKAEAATVLRPEGGAGSFVSPIASDGVAPSTPRAESPGRSPSPSLHDGEVSAGEPGLSDIQLATLGVKIDRTDWAGTADSFDNGIEAAGARGDLALVVALCDARMRVWKAMFHDAGGYRPSGDLSPRTPGASAPPPPPSAVPLPHEGEERLPLSKRTG